MDFDAVWRQSVNQLNQSIIDDNYDEFLNLLQQDVSINSPDNRGYLPIHLCCLTINPYPYLIELLKFDIVNVNAQTYEGYTPLILLSQNTRSPLTNLIDSFKLLVQNGADINLSNNHLEFPLLESIKTGKYELVEFLCSKPEINLNAQDNQGISVIHEAVRQTNLKYLELILKYDARIDLLNSDLASPLFYAAFYRNCKAVSILVELSKKKGIIDYVNMPTYDNTNPLMISCQTNCLDCIKFLLNNGANVNLITTDQVTVLHFIAEFCDCEVLKLIMNHGFDLTKIPTFTDLNDKRILEMKNPVHLAISSSNFNILKYFIEEQLFSVNSLQIIEDFTISNLRINSKLFYSTLAFALSIRSNKKLIDYLVLSGAALDFYSDLIVPPVFCVFNSIYSIDKCIKVFKRILKFGFDVNKFASLKCDNYLSNFILIIFLPELLKNFINYGLISENLFSFDLCTQKLDFNNIEFSRFVNEKNGLMNLFKSFSLIKRNENVFKFWNYLKSKIQNDLTDFSDELVKIDKLFETPDTLKKLCLYEFRKLIWQQTTRNSAKYNEHVKNLNISPVIKIALLDD